MSGQGIYLYGFARAGAARGHEEGGGDGILWIEGGDVAAAFSRVSLDEFTGETGERNLHDPEWLVPRACRHEQVIEEVMKSSPVLPSRFGTVFASREALAGVLAENRDAIARGLDSLSGKEEWSVKGFLNAKRTVEWALAVDPVLSARHAARSRSPGVRYLQEKRLGVEAERLAKSLCRAAVERIRDDLGGLAAEQRSLPLRSMDASGRADERVFHGAFLLLAGGVQAFRERVRELGDAHAKQGIALESSGPWPPYNFCPAIGKGTP